MGISGCTLSEPDSGDGSVYEDSLKLKSVSSLGVTLFDIDYDNSGRITKMTLGGGKDMMEYDFQYSGDVTLPNVISYCEYESIPKGEDYVKELVESDIWKDIQYVDGKITSFTYTETQYFVYYEYDYYTELYSRNVSSQENSGTRILEYDSNGYLISDSDTCTDNINGTTHDKTVYNWEDGLLLSVMDNDTSELLYTIRYSEENNIHRQWDINNEIFGPLAVAGFMGKAPAKFISEISTYSKGAYMDETIYYAYVIAENGYIDLAKSGTDADELSLTLKYHYIKK